MLRVFYWVRIDSVSSSYVRSESFRNLDRNELEDLTSLVGLFDGLTELKRL